MKMRLRKVFFWSILLILSTTAGWWAYKKLYQGERSYYADNSIATPTAENWRKRHVADQQVLTEPLPGLDEPVANIELDLKKRVDRGDVLAACRLAFEYRQCANLEDRARTIEKWASVQGRKLRDDESEGAVRQAEIVADRLDTIREEVKRVSEHCAGVSDKYRSIASLTFMAAQAGHRPSMKVFSLGLDLDGNTAAGNVEDYIVYRQYAELYARRLVSEGDAQMMYELAMAYAKIPAARASSTLTQVVDENKVEALILLFHLDQILNTGAERASAGFRSSIRRSIQLLQEKIPAEDVMKAQSLLNDRRREWESQQLTSVPVVDALEWVEPLAAEDCTSRWSGH